MCAVQLLVFGLDRATGAAPVSICTTCRLSSPGSASDAGRRDRAVTAILLYHLANPHLLTFRYREQDIVQIVLFLAVGMVTAKLTHDGDRLRQLAPTDDSPAFTTCVHSRLSWRQW